MNPIMYMSFPPTNLPSDGGNYVESLDDWLCSASHLTPLLYLGQSYRVLQVEEVVERWNNPGDTQCDVQT